MPRVWWERLALASLTQQAWEDVAPEVSVLQGESCSLLGVRGWGPPLPVASTRGEELTHTLQVAHSHSLPADPLGSSSQGAWVRAEPGGRACPGEHILVIFCSRRITPDREGE